MQDISQTSKPTAMDIAPSPINIYGSSITLPTIRK